MRTLNIVLIILGITTFSVWLTFALFEYQYKFKALCGVVSVLLLASAIVSTVYTSNRNLKLEEQRIEESWNNGRCHCGGELRLFDVTSTKYDVYYVYICDKCDHTIQFDKPMK